MQTVIIGSGNVATVLGKKFVAAGHRVLQVCGRNADAVNSLAASLQAASCHDLRHVDPGADLYVIAVSDDAIAPVASRLQLPRKLVVHTAGSVSREVLKVCSSNYGVLYPLQSLRKEVTELPDIPILADGNTADDLALIVEFARTFSQQVCTAGDEQRLRLHLAAVMVSNFTNHLYTLAEDYCRRENADFRLLIPLISTIAARVAEFSPAAVQTGPAVRHDTKTIGKHLELLQQHPELKAFYQLFTDSIQERHKGESRG